MPAPLPEGFEDLARFTDRWLKPTENARHRTRLAASAEELKDLYDTLLPRMEAILQHLDRHDIHALPEAEQNLMGLALAFIEVSAAVEVFGGSPTVPYGFDPERWRVHF